METNNCPFVHIEKYLLLKIRTKKVTITLMIKGNAAETQDQTADAISRLKAAQDEDVA